MLTYDIAKRRLLSKVRYLIILSYQNIYVTSLILKRFNLCHGSRTVPTHIYTVPYLLKLYVNKKRLKIQD